MPPEKAADKKGKPASGGAKKVGSGKRKKPPEHGADGGEAAKKPRRRDALKTHSKKTGGGVATGGKGGDGAEPRAGPSTTVPDGAPRTKTVPSVAKLQVGGRKTKKAKKGASGAAGEGAEVATAAGAVKIEAAPVPKQAVQVLPTEEELAEQRMIQERICKECSAVLTKIMSHEASRAFREPVNWREMRCFDYPKVVKNPIDLGTIQKRLLALKYKSAEEFSRDVRMVWANAKLWNKKNTIFYATAASCNDMFEASLQSLCAKLDLQVSLPSASGDPDEELGFMVRAPPPPDGLPPSFWEEGGAFDTASAAGLPCLVRLKQGASTLSCTIRRVKPGSVEVAYDPRDVDPSLPGWLDLSVYDVRVAGRIVWVKVPGFSRYPAQVYETVGQDLAPPGEAKKWPVNFFGEGTWSFSPAGWMSAFDPTTALGLIPKKKTPKGLEISVNEAIAYHAKEIQTRKEKAHTKTHLVGQSIHVQWDSEEWYFAIVKRFDEPSGLHLLLYYDDDLTEWSKLDSVHWKLLATDWKWDIPREPEPCLVCQRAVGAPGSFLDCALCRTAFHPPCFGSEGAAQLQEIRSGSKKQWFCRSCKPCTVCGMATRAENILACAKCDKRRHQSCMLRQKEGDHEANYEGWRCEECLQCQVCLATEPRGTGERSERYWSRKANLGRDQDKAAWKHCNTMCEPCGRMADEKRYCPTCKRMREDGEKAEAMVKCNGCEQWGHVTCTGLALGQFKTLSQIGEKGGAEKLFFCGECQKKKFRETAESVVQELFEKDSLNLIRQADLKALVAIETPMDLNKVHFDPF